MYKLVFPGGTSLRFRYIYCSDGSTLLWYGDNYNDMNWRWQLSKTQLRVLKELRSGPLPRRELTRIIAGRMLTPSARASLSRTIRTMKDQSLITIGDGTIALTECGENIHDDLKATGCIRLDGGEPEPLPPLHELLKLSKR